MAGAKSVHDVQSRPSETVARRPPDIEPPAATARPVPEPSPDGRPDVPDTAGRPGPPLPEQQTLEQLLDSVRRLIKKYHVLENENQELRRRLDELRRRTEAAEQENQRLRSRLEQLEAERDAIRLQVAELVRELESLELE